MANSVYPDQTGSTLFTSLLNSSVKLGTYLQQTTAADDIFQIHFFRVKALLCVFFSSQ